jgi:predicted transcriptional regulator of viral defense system
MLSASAPATTVPGEHRRMSQAEVHTPELLLARESSPSERTRLALRAQRGELIRVARGAYLTLEQWSSLDRDARYRATIDAIAATIDPMAIFSHASAAALWRLPWLDGWPDGVHATIGPASGGRSAGTLHRHAPSRPTPTSMIDGLRVTTLARTVVDVAASRSFIAAVVTTDAALGMPELDGDELAWELGRLPHRQGAVRARAAIEFANARSGSPGESISRCTMRRLGLPAPVLQQRFDRPRGRYWEVDFWWPDLGVIGEFDGAAKYLRPELRNGRSAEQIVYEEKLREDELRRRSRGFARWDMAVARSPQQLARRLANVGVGSLLGARRGRSH